MADGGECLAITRVSSISRLDTDGARIGRTRAREEIVACCQVIGFVCCRLRDMIVQRGGDGGKSGILHSDAREDRKVARRGVVARGAEAMRIDEMRMR